MSLNAANIDKRIGQNTGGTGTLFYYAFLTDILSWPAALPPDFDAATAYANLIEVPVDDPFVMKTGKQFFSVYCTLEEGELKYTQIGPRDCAAFENSYTNAYPGNDSDYLGFMAYLANHQIVVIVPEQNGKLRGIGTPSYPAFVEKQDGTSGKKIADGRMNTVTFFNRCSTPPWTYLAPVPLTPAA